MTMPPKQEMMRRNDDAPKPRNDDNFSEQEMMIKNDDALPKQEMMRRNDNVFPQQEMMMSLKSKK